MSYFRMNHYNEYMAEYMAEYYYTNPKKESIKKNSRLYRWKSELKHLDETQLQIALEQKEKEYQERRMIKEEKKKIEKDKNRHKFIYG